MDTLVDPVVTLGGHAVGKTGFSGTVWQGSVVIDKTWGTLAQHTLSVSGAKDASGNSMTADTSRQYWVDAVDADFVSLSVFDTGDPADNDGIFRKGQTLKVRLVTENDSVGAATAEVNNTAVGWPGNGKEAMASFNTGEDYTYEVTWLITNEVESDRYTVYTWFGSGRTRTKEIIIDNTRPLVSTFDIFDIEGNPDPFGEETVCVTLEFVDLPVFGDGINTSHALSVYIGTKEVTGAWRSAAAWSGEVLIPGGWSGYQTLEVSGATDFAGNTMETDASCAYMVDTVKPEIFSVSSVHSGGKAGTPEAQAFDNGYVTFEIVFDKAMDTTVNPVVTLGGHTVAKSSYSGSTWIGLAHITSSWGTTAEMVFSVSSARDLVGNVMIPDTSGGYWVAPKPGDADFGSLDSRDDSISQDSDEVYHAGQQVRIVLVTTADDTGAATVEITNAATGWGGTGKLAMAVDSFIPFVDQYTYKHVWDTTGLTSSEAYLATVWFGNGHTESFGLTLDNTKPTAAVLVTSSTLPSAAPFSAEVLTVVVNFTDGPAFSTGMNTKETLAVSFSGIGSVSGAWTSNVQWSGTKTISPNQFNGTSTLTVTGANDRAANAADPWSGTFEIDTAKPFCTNIAALPPSPFGSETVRFVVTFSDSGSHMNTGSAPAVFLCFGPTTEIAVDQNSGWSDSLTWSGEVDVPSGWNGTCSVVVTGASDRAGYVADAFEALFEVDTASPEVALVQTDPGPVLPAGSVEIGVIFNELMDTGEVLTVLLSGEVVIGGWGDDFTWSGEISVPDGWNGYAACAVGGGQDLAGNRMLTDETQFLLVDTKKPLISSIDPPENLEADAFGNGYVYFDVTFDETMEASIEPLVTLGGHPLYMTGYGGQVWTGRAHITSSWGAKARMTMEVSLARDSAGNVMLPDSSRRYWVEPAAGSADFLALDTRDFSDHSDSDETYHAGQSVEIVLTTLNDTSGAAYCEVIKTNGGWIGTGLQDMSVTGPMSGDSYIYKFVWNTSGRNESDAYRATVTYGSGDAVSIDIRLDNTQPMLSNAVVTSSVMPSASPFTAEVLTVTLSYSDNPSWSPKMDTTRPLTVAFSGIGPVSGNWLSNLQWRGTITVAQDSYNGTSALTATGAFDRAGNSAVATPYNFVFDTSRPVVASVSPDPPDPFCSETIDFLVTFDDGAGTKMKTTYPATVKLAHTGSSEVAVSGMWLSNLLWSGSGTVPAGWNGTCDVTISGARDSAGYSITSHKTVFEVDTLKPTVLSVSPASGTTLPEGATVFTIDFNEAMDSGSALTVTFNGNAVTGDFSDSDTWIGSYSIPAGWSGSKTLSISGGTDPAGNVMTADSSRTYPVDTVKPEILSVSASHTSGKPGTPELQAFPSGFCTFEIVFTKAMNSSVAPVILFGGHTVETRSYSGTTWIGRVHITASWGATAETTLAVSGARDSAGNTMAPDSTRKWWVAPGPGDAAFRSLDTRDSLNANDSDEIYHKGQTVNIVLKTMTDNMGEASCRIDKTGGGWAGIGPVAMVVLETPQDANEYYTYQYSWNTTGRAEGSDYRATVYYGKDRTSEINILIDNTKPVVSSVSALSSTLPAAEPFSAEVVTVTVSFSDSPAFAGGMDTSVNITPFFAGIGNVTGTWTGATTWSGTISFAPDSFNGLTTLEISGAYDRAGNSIITWQDTCEVDTSKPVVAGLATIPAAPFKRELVSLKWSFTDSGTKMDTLIEPVARLFHQGSPEVAIDIDSGWRNNLTWSGEVWIPDTWNGTCAVRLYGAYDRVGYMADTHETIVIVDTIKPFIQSLSPPAGSLLGFSKVPLLIQFSEEMRTQEVLSVKFGTLTVAGAWYSAVTWSGEISVPYTWNGDVTLMVSGGRDLARNTMTSSANVYHADTYPPVVTAVTPSVIGTIGHQPVSFTIDFSDNAPYGMDVTKAPTVAFGGVSLTGSWYDSDTWIGSMTPAYGWSGWKVLTISGARDAAGNTMPLYSGYSQQVDTIQPAVSSITTLPPAPIGTVSANPYSNGFINFTVNFSKTMDTTVNPVIALGGRLLEKTGYAGSVWTGRIWIDSSWGDLAQHTLSISGAFDTRLNEMADDNSHKYWVIYRDAELLSIGSSDDIDISDNDEIYHTGQRIVFTLLTINDTQWRATCEVTNAYGPWGGTGKQAMTAVDLGGGYWKYTYSWDTTSRIESEYYTAEIYYGFSKSEKIRVKLDNTRPVISNVTMLDEQGKPAPFGAEVVYADIDFTDTPAFGGGMDTTLNFSVKLDDKNFSGNWIDADTWRGSLEIQYAWNWNGSRILVVSGARDYAGNSILTDLSRSYVIDSGRPTVSSVVTTPPAPQGTSMVNPFLIGWLTFEVTFSESMETTAGLVTIGGHNVPVVSFSGNTWIGRVLVDQTWGSLKDLALTVEQARDASGNEMLSDSSRSYWVLGSDGTDASFYSIDTWDATDTTDKDEFYHAGQQIKVVLRTTADTSAFANCEVFNGSIGWAGTGSQPMTAFNLGSGNYRYEFTWDTTGRAESDTYQARVYFGDGKSETLTIKLDNTSPFITAVTVKDGSGNSAPFTSEVAHVTVDFSDSPAFGGMDTPRSLSAVFSGIGTVSGSFISATRWYGSIAFTQDTFKGISTLTVSNGYDKAANVAPTWTGTFEVDTTALTGLSLSVYELDLPSGNTLELTDITVRAHYSNGFSREVTNVSWTAESGVIVGTLYTSPGIDVLTCSYTEWSVTKTVDLIIRTNSLPTTPVPVSTVTVEVTTGKPGFHIYNSTDPDGDTLWYEFWYSKTDDFSSYVTSTGLLPGGSGGRTAYTMETELEDMTYYYWKARAYDGFGYSSWSQVKTIFVILDLKLFFTCGRGWNMISINFDPVNPSIDKMLETIEAQDRFSMVQSYTFVFNNSTGLYDAKWQTYSPVYSVEHPANSLKTMSPGRAYWIRMSTTETTFMLSGRPPGMKTLHFLKGWNMFGCVGTSIVPIDQALEGIAGKYLLVLRYDPNNPTNWKIYHPSKPIDNNTLKTIEPGMGYWIKVTDSEAWLTLGENY
ncbi:MAG: hypothetical protein PHQ23_03400 [Candidatus Wallbacteria bacterium]|nr:hypothetical protein [Candidatus Wallbacteria bacterium]